MISITSSQIAFLAKIEKEKFVQKSLLFLNYNFPEWAKGKSEEELKIFVNQVINMAMQYDLSKERSVQKLMYFIIQFQMPIPLSKELSNILTPSNTTEALRIKNLYKAIAK